jgi:signal transduction histidine kinase
VSLGCSLRGRRSIAMRDDGRSVEGRTNDFQPSGPDGKRREVESRVQDYQRQLRRLASELSLAEARERREIASDLHDHIGQALAFVAQKVRAIRRNSIFSGMDEDFSQVLSILDQAIRYTRDLTVEISPPVLYELGLPAAIEWEAERALKMHNLEVSLSQSGVPSEIAEDVRVFTFKAIQELINNVAKHAEADKVEVRSNWREREFEIIVSDDGRGFDPSKPNAGPAKDSCFGLFSIRERLSYIGGTLTIVSSPGKGTRVSIVAPYGVAEEGGVD